MNDPFSTFQSLGRIHRAHKPVKLVIPDPLEMEARIAARLAHRLATEQLPELVITDETVMLKNGQVLLFGPGSEGTGVSLHPEGLDKK
jgi:hypothetical protein